ncbi:hypothetical protein [Thermotoga sp.]|uniref:hypothetical protein n=1 Tax=Thermotoga sp. TaxID=28240 RepID=UPI0025D02E9D|nr:hypothetical protein [Thermotoga sp.]
MEKRLALLLAVFALFLVVSFINLFFFPLGGQKSHWYISIPPKRGSILDAKGRKIAYDFPVYVAYLDVDFFKRQLGDKSVLERTLKACGVEKNPEEVLKHRFYRLTEAEDKENVLKRLDPAILPFVSLEIEYRREKLQDYSTGVLIGTVLNGRGKAASKVSSTTF